MAKMKLLHLHPVQTIGTENIVAGTLVTSTPTATTNVCLCLVHGKVVGSEVSVMVRTKASDFSLLLSQALTTILS